MDVEYRNLRGYDYLRMISIIIAEDHTIVREGLRMLLEAAQDISVLGEAENGRVAVSLCQKLKPDIVLMDIAMPYLNGLEASHIITNSIPETKVIILSMYPDEEYILEALNAGAMGFLVKKTASGELLRAVREVNYGRAFFSPEVSKTVLDAYRDAKKAVSTEHMPATLKPLTGREREIIQLIAEGYNSRKIAKQLFISIKTVASHRQNIMKKLDIHDIAGLTRYAIKKGLIRAEHQ